MDEHTRHHLHESPAVVTFPLIMLAIPSVLIGALAVGPVLFQGYFAEAIQVLPQHNVLGELGKHYTGPLGFILHGLMAPAFWLAVAGVLVAWYVYLRQPAIADTLKERLRPLYNVLVNKYGFDGFNEAVFAGGGRVAGRLLWRVGDAALIDGVLVNGTARAIGWFAGVLRNMQSGYLYHYAFAMILGLLVLLTWFVIG